MWRDGVKQRRLSNDKRAFAAKCVCSTSFPSLWAIERPSTIEELNTSNPHSMEMIKLIRKLCNCSAKRKEKNKNISRYFGLVLSSSFEFFHNA